MNLQEIFQKRLTEYSLIELQEIAEAISTVYHESKDRAVRKELKKKFEALSRYYNHTSGMKIYNETL